jgi:hypothetical protein
MDPLTSAELSSDFIKPKANFLRAPRKISAFQCFCGHEKAANRAA